MKDIEEDLIEVEGDKYTAVWRYLLSLFSGIVWTALTRYPCFKLLTHCYIFQKLNIIVSHVPHPRFLRRAVPDC